MENWTSGCIYLMLKGEHAMQVEFSVCLLAYFWKKEFLMTLKTFALHSVFFIALVFQGMLEIFWKYFSNHIIWVPKKIHRYWIQFSSFLGTALFLKEIFVTISGNWNDPDWTVTFCPVTPFLLVHVWLYKLQKRINLPIGCFTAVTSCVVSLFFFFSCFLLSV